MYVYAWSASRQASVAGLKVEFLLSLLMNTSGKSLLKIQKTSNVIRWLRYSYICVNAVRH